MCKRAGIILLVIFAGILSLNHSTARSNSRNASAEIKSRFDLPAESLDKALRDFAIQANCNIAYEPSIVAGLQAPAIKGEFTASNVLSLILIGTNLRAINVNEDTIQIVEKMQPTRDVSTTPADTHPSGSYIVRLADAGADVPAPKDPSPTPDAEDSTANDTKGRDKSIDEIVVTGTHIRGVSSASPVIEIGREEIDRSGFTSVTDLMLSLPENFGGGYNPGTTYNSQVNTRYSDNPTGASVPNLRGLGPGSTLTLVDGHRMASGLTGGGADISSIPLDAIARIEVVTDSASAIYGSDAVAGVVNVILKRDYDGAKTSLSYGLATQGGGTERRASQLFGTSWNSGNAMIAYEHLEQDVLFARDRAFTSLAPDPYSLLPQIRSNSVTVSATQDIASTTSVFVDGLFIDRDANSFVNESGLIAAFDQPSTLRKYAVAAGFNFNLFSDWKATVFANIAEDATENDSSYLTPGSLTPSGDERLLGALRNVEANANGSIATLPSGTVRLAGGAGYRKETFSDLFGTTGGPFTDRTDGDRNIRYVFGELSIPLVAHSQRPGLNYFDLVVSGRNERYSDFGSKTVPKVGLVYAPTGSIKLRSTWGKAFRAPNLDDTNAVQQLVILDLANPTATTGSSPALIRTGGNPGLQPETADAWSFGVDISPPDGNVQVSATLFDIEYTNRISQIENPFTALTDPLSAFFVTESPSSSVTQAVYNAYPANETFNNTNSPLNPTQVGAIVEDRLINVARQAARGADLSVNYRFGTSSNGTSLFFNGTYLDLTQKNTPQLPEQTLSGLSFYPARTRLRTGATWKRASWALTSTLNYLASETNTQVTPTQSVGSWTTVDASVRYAPILSGFLGGLSFNLSAINLFDRNPPRVLIPPTVVGANLNYDSSNTSPLGRFIRLQVSKAW
jgi:iron complex outermembrane receptor protein